jgi:hypothetical protein
MPPVNPFIVAFCTVGGTQARQLATFETDLLQCQFINILLGKLKASPWHDWYTLPTQAASIEAIGCAIALGGVVYDLPLAPR